MRSLFYSLLSLATIASTLAADVPTESPAETVTDDWDEAVPDTLFNGQTVPAMKELSSVDITKEISQGNWYATSRHYLHVTFN